MIRIQPGGTHALIITGFKPEKSEQTGGRLGEGAKKAEFTFSTAKLLTGFSESRIEAEITAEKEFYLKELTLSFKIHTPKPERKLTLWSESHTLQYSGGQYPPPGALSTGKNRQGYWAMWIAEEISAEGMFFKTKTAGTIPLKFECSPVKKRINITWQIGKTLKENEILTLPPCLISRGTFNTLHSSWKSEWKTYAAFPGITDSMKTGWIPSFGPAVTSGKRKNKEYSYYKNITENLNKLNFYNFKPDWIAIGPQYAQEYGDWLEPSEEFKNKMGSLSRQIEEQNMTPAIVLAPFTVSSGSVIAAEHPEWLVKSSKETPLKIPSAGRSKEKHSVLDITRKDVQEHIKNFLSVIKNQWGYRMFVMEELSASAHSGIRSDNSIAYGELINKASALIRDALGWNTVLIASDLPLLLSVKEWNARMLSNPRITGSSVNKNTAVRNSAAAQSMLQHAYWNNETWVNAAAGVDINYFFSRAENSAPDKKHTDKANKITYSETSLVNCAAFSAGMIIFSGSLPQVHSKEKKTPLNTAGNNSAGSNKKSSETSVLYTEQPPGSAALEKFTRLFSDCSKGKIKYSPDITGRTSGIINTENKTGRKSIPVMLRNSRGWILLFNPAAGEKHLTLKKEQLRAAFGVTAALNPGENTVLNSPEIVVTLPPYGSRILKG